MKLIYLPQVDRFVDMYKKPKRYWSYDTAFKKLAALVGPSLAMKELEALRAGHIVHEKPSVLKIGKKYYIADNFYTYPNALVKLQKLGLTKRQAMYALADCED